MARFDIDHLKLDSLMDDMRREAGKRAADMLGDGRAKARHATGGHDGGALFSMFALGILVGAFAGAAVALLMTPMSGNEARKKLSERVDSMRGGEPTGAAWETTSPGNGTPAAPRTYSPTSLS